MSKFKQKDPARTGNVFQFTLTGLILFSLVLLSPTVFIANKFYQSRPRRLAETFAVNPNDKSETVHVGAWGELVERDIQLERPIEMLGENMANPKPESWTFNGLNPGAIKTLLAQNGLTAAQVDTLFATGSCTTNNSTTELVPAANFLFSLNAKTRLQLYLGLSHMRVNTYLDYPYIFPGDTISSIYEDIRLHPDDVALLKQLVFTNTVNNSVQLSDFDTLLCKIPTTERRVAMARVLSRQKAVFAGLLIKPDTDIDKIASYWGHIPGVRFNNIRPLMEAIKALPGGGELKLFYLLPRFARDRIYTYPLPSKPGDPIKDCNWTTFNFSSETPNNHLAESNNLANIIDNDYYAIDAPSVYGDVILILNDKKQLIHSATFLADDLVFTKNGDNYRQPWMIMHISDMLATYPGNSSFKVRYIRRKTD